MAITRTLNKAYASELTAAEINALDANVASALDKRGGQSDTLASTVTVTGAIEVAAGGSVTVDASADLDVSGVETIEAGGSLVIASAGSETVASGGTLTVASGGRLTTAVGSVCALNTPTINNPVIAGGSIANCAFTGGTVNAPSATVGSLTVTGDCAINGNLTVKGTFPMTSTSTTTPGAVSFDKVVITNSSFGGAAGTIGAVTINSATISGGSMATTALSAVTIAGSTATGLKVDTYPSFVASKSLTRCVPTLHYVSTNKSAARNYADNFTSPTTAFTVDTLGQIWFLAASSSNVCTGIMLSLDDALVDGGTFSLLEAQVGRGSSTGTPPARPVAFVVFRRGWTNTTPESLLSYAPLGTYHEDGNGESAALHTVSLTVDQSNVIDKSLYTYYVQVWGECGDVNAQSNLKLNGMRATCSVPDMRIA